MLGWFKHTQELTSNLHKAAGIIRQQNRHSLQWALGRMWEFAEILAHTYGLIPDRVHNGFDWTGSHKKSEDDLAFFDHYYGVSKDPYEVHDGSIRLGLQCREGRHPTTVVEAQLNIVSQDGDAASMDDEELTPLCDGTISLVGQCGVWWLVRVRLFAMKKESMRRVIAHFGDLIPADYFCEQDGTTFQFNINAAKARKFFHTMVQYSLAKHG